MDIINVATSYTFPAPAKINLFLHITEQRADGYHNLQTVFQFLDYGDELTIKPIAENKLTFLTDFPNVKPEDNLIMKAATLLKEHANYMGGAEISINKVLPMGGGLGGGSSDAATVLVALNKLWQLHYSTEQLATLGLTLGADVPIFIHGFAAFAEGIGEQLTPVEPIEYWYLITKPHLSIATQTVFTAKDLTRNTPRIQPQQWDIDTCHNDCETWVRKHHPEVANLLAWLIEYAPSRMTGTGACVFSRFTTEQEARNIQKQLPEGIHSFVAKGINQSPLISAIKNSR